MELEFAFTTAAPFSTDAVPCVSVISLPASPKRTPRLPQPVAACAARLTTRPIGIDLIRMSGRRGCNGGMLACFGCRLRRCFGLFARGRFPQHNHLIQAEVRVIGLRPL